MRFAICFWIFILIVCSEPVRAQNEIRLEINSKLPAKYAKKPKGYTATSASQLLPFVEISIKQVDYVIAFDQQTLKIKYIYTHDEHFTSADGRKVGQEITLTWDKIDILPYFQVRGPADKNGWQPVIGGSPAFEGDFLERVRKAGRLTTEIDGFAKGYNY